MPQTITISKTDPAVNHISVDHDVVTVDTNVVTFVNSLVPANDAIIAFYRNGRQKEAQNPIKDPCGEGSDTILVPAGTSKPCTIRNGIRNREYLYSIEAMPQYVTLDPVIILDRPGKGSGEGFGFLALAVAVVIGGGVGVIAGRMSVRRAKPESQN